MLAEEQDFYNKKNSIPQIQQPPKPINMTKLAIEDHEISDEGKVTLMPSSAISKHSQG